MKMFLLFFIKKKKKKRKKRKKDSPFQGLKASKSEGDSSSTSVLVPSVLASPDITLPPEPEISSMAPAASTLNPPETSSSQLYLPVLSANQSQVLLPPISNSNSSSEGSHVGSTLCAPEDVDVSATGILANIIGDVGSNDSKAYKLAGDYNHKV
ncbi:hypothetical protein ACE6H2_016495 [Prunus campanulata]